MNGFQRVVKAFAIALAVFIIVNIAGWMIFGISMFVGILDISKEHSNSHIEPAEPATFPNIYTEEIAKELKEIDVEVKTAELNIITTDNDFLNVSLESGKEENFTVKESNRNIKNRRKR